VIRPTATIARCFLYTLLVLSISACEDRFRIDLSEIESENELVVEGFITDQEGPHRIRLTRTLAIGSGSTAVPREGGAMVQVIDRQGNTHTLTEIDAGVYQTNEAEFQAEAGNAYQLKIELADGEVYESDFQELLPVEPIDELWFERGPEEVVEGTFVTEADVVKFFTNYESQSGPAYYRYDYFVTYEFTSEQQGSSGCWQNDPQNIPDDLAVGITCYVNESGRLITNVSTYPDPIAGDVGFAKIFSLDFDIRFRLGTSVQVKKYALTKDYHDFLSAVREQGEFGGSIFDSPPTQIVGNIRNVNDPKQFALGYFTTLALTTKRIFVPGLGYQPPSDRCDVVDDIPPPKDCCDCRQKIGASDRRPDFWIVGG